MQGLTQIMGCRCQKAGFSEVGEFELLRALPYLLLETLDKLCVLNRNGDLSRQERLEVRAFRRKRPASQVVLQIHQPNELALIEDRLAEDGASFSFLNIG